MSYEQFLDHHLELEGLPESTKREAYSMYLEQLDEAMEFMEEE